MLADGTPAMVMELIEGQSLRDVLVERRFTVKETVSLLGQALAALAVCHDAGIVHRDLKPENLLLETRQDGPWVRLIDFGLTKLTADEGATALTVNGEVFGSPRFMAPEQWFRNAVDGRTDLYALALIGYWMVLGTHFIQPSNPVDVCRAHLQQARPDLAVNALGEAVPPGLARALAMAANPEPAERPADARAMIAVLSGKEPVAVAAAAATGDLLETSMGSPAFSIPRRLSASEATLSFHASALAPDDRAGGFEAGDDATTIEDQEDEGAEDEDPEAATLVDDGGLAAQLAAALNATPSGHTAPVPERASEEIRQFRHSDVQAALRETDERPLAPQRDEGASMDEAPRARGSRPMPRPQPVPDRTMAGPARDEGRGSSDARVLLAVVVAAVALGAVVAAIFLR